MKLEKDETVLKGSWKFNGSSLVADEVSNRIDKLTSSYLVRINSDESGWNILFLDPSDKRYWELSYPESGSHGGGAPLLKNLSRAEAKSKYQI